MQHNNALISFDELFESAPPEAPDPVDFVESDSISPDPNDPQSYIIEPIPAFTLTARGHDALETLSEGALAELEERVQTTRARMGRAYIFATTWDETLVEHRPEHILGLLSRYQKEAPDTFRLDVEAPRSDIEVVQAVARVRDIVFQLLREGVEGFEELEERFDDLAYQAASDIEDEVDDLGVEFLNDDARSEAELDAHISLSNNLPNDIVTLRNQRLFLIHTMADKMLNLVLDADPEEPLLKKHGLRIVE